MYKLRHEDDSVYLYIKDIVLSPFIERLEKESLVFMEDLSEASTSVYEIDTPIEPSPFDRGRGLVYFDELTGHCLINTATYSGTPEQSNRVTVFDKDLNVIDDTKYMIDYIDGRIITTPDIKPVYIDYYWNYISLVDEWSAITAADPPVVVIDVSGTDKKGYQIGPGKNVIRKVTFHIFASSPAERNDIVEVLYDGLYLKSCPLYELPNGTVLDYDGTFYGRRHNMNKNETLFSRATVSGVSALMFDNVSHRNISLPLSMSRGMDKVMLSDLNAYRAKITCDLSSYTVS